MLEMTRIKLENISDNDMYLFIEKGLRGGTSYICESFSEANKKDIKNHDSTKPSKYITYLDENNLYEWAMSGYLLYGKFKWLKNVDNFDVNSINENSSVGYIFSKLILNILMKYIHNLLFLMTCSQTIIKKLLINME